MPADQRLKDALRLILEDPEEQERSGRRRKRGDGHERWHGTTAVYPHNWEELGYVEYFYRRDTILVRTEDMDLVLEALREAPAIIPEEVAIDRLPVIDGVTGLVWRYGRTAESVQAGRAKYGGKEFGGTYDGQYNDDDELSTPNVLARLDQVLGVGKGTPDHGLPLNGNGHPCPAKEPTEVPSKSVTPEPPVSDGICCGTPGWDGRGVFVGVVDAGLVLDAPKMWPWMEGVDGDPEDPFMPNGHIKPYSCHGTFVAGCVRCTAPKAKVRVKKAEYIDNRPFAGMAYEHEIIRKMSDLLDEGADVIVCEFDGFTRFHRPMHTFNAFYDRRLRHLNVVVVAPAGNDTTFEPTFPAAYSWVLGVGALSADGNDRAYFSNYGGWVDVYGPGEDLVNAFAVGDYTCIDAPYGQLHFDGLAKWSGTSFSTPLVAGMIAARMAATGENAPLATEALLRLARSQAVPGVGPVLLPHDVCGTPREPCRTHCDCGCGCRS
ncbi:S8 family serine peptidase [Kribbella sp. NPDC049174]|uniref:S8 family peptidase n=1 Tax=Kribbella sp. NPDC049174 TaxID=3364112 RepID=UPI00371240E2